MPKFKVFGYETVVYEEREIEAEDEQTANEMYRELFFRDETRPEKEDSMDFVVETTEIKEGANV
jgi:hypothetical protein